MRKEGLWFSLRGLTQGKKKKIHEVQKTQSLSINHMYGQDAREARSSNLFHDEIFCNLDEMFTCLTRKTIHNYIMQGLKQEQLVLL